MEIDTIFYDLPDGTEPAKEFIRGLDRKMRAKMVWTIALLESTGTDIQESYSKHLTDGIFELRAKVGSDISRVLYFFVIGRRAILTHGFIKKDDKTPPVEIDRAKKYPSIMCPMSFGSQMLTGRKRSIEKYRALFFQNT